MVVQNITDHSFLKYGRILRGYDCAKLIREMEHTPLPGDVIYVPSVEELEALSIYKELQDLVFGGLPIQIGYCNGNNNKINALEYHRSSEINIAITDLILLIGRQQDITQEFTYDTSKVEAYLVPKGTVIEIYATTLHYAPCTVSKGGFKCAVILPKDTNTELTFVPGTKGDEKMLYAKNKWLIAHQDAKIKGAYCGLIGDVVICDLLRPEMKITMPLL